MGLSTRALLVSGLLALPVWNATAHAQSCEEMLAGFAPATSDIPLIVPDPGEGPIIGPGEANINRDAQISHGVTLLRKKHSLSGSGITVGVWDQAAVLAKHREFDTRVTLGDAGKVKVYSRHATHVAGTIAARGLNKQAEGMAPQARVVSYNWDENGREVCEAAAGRPGGTKLSISNHSYGPVAGWTFSGDPACRWRWYGDISAREDSRFGKYERRSAGLFDAIVFANPFHSIFVAGGNDRGDDPHEDPQWDRSYCTSDGTKRTWTDGGQHPASDGGRKGGYFTISGYALAKNVITVGAVADILKPKEQRTRSDLITTTFSSWGPANDGRVRPDVVANGFELESPVLAEGSTKPISEPNLRTDAYRKLSGTSMAAPTATGIGALLNELSDLTSRRVLRADEMKAVLVHTAWSKNEDNSPSYIYGYGLIQAEAAGDLLKGEGGKLFSLDESRTPFTKQLLSAGTQPIRVTVAWLDPAGSITEVRGASRDLDLKLISPKGTVHYPWALDPKQPSKGASHTRKNSVDNIERIDVPGAKVERGTWTISVTHSNSEEVVPFALITTGLD